MDDIQEKLANRKATDLLDPRNDYVFKRLFADEPELLIELINAIRYRETPITELQIIDPTVRPESIEQKTIKRRQLPQPESCDWYFPAGP